jgi:hypothetical protein
LVVARGTDFTARDLGRGALFGVLGVPAGVALAFLTLELIGLPLVALVIGMSYRVLRRHPTEFCVLMLTVGVSFAGTVGVASGWGSHRFTGSATAFSIVWNAVAFLFGLSLVLGALVLQHRAGAAHRH